MDPVCPRATQKTTVISIVKLIGKRNNRLAKFAFRVELKARPGKEADVEAFLAQGAALAKKEQGIVTWYAFKDEDQPGVYGIFDTFDDAAGREAHVSGELAKALFGKADELFSEAPALHRLAVISNK